MMLRWKGLDSRRCRFDTFSNNNRVRRIENERRRRRKRSSRTAETCVYMCICMSEREREYMCGIDPFFHCLPIVCSRPWVNRPRRAYDGQNRLALACTRVTTDQEHVTLVAHAYRFRWIRQGRGVVAASVAEDLAAVSTMVLEHKWLIWQLKKSYWTCALLLMWRREYMIWRKSSGCWELFFFVCILRIFFLCFFIPISSLWYGNDYICLYIVHCSFES